MKQFFNKNNGNLLTKFFNVHFLLTLSVCMYLYNNIGPIKYIIYVTFNEFEKSIIKPLKSSYVINCFYRLLELKLNSNFNRSVHVIVILILFLT